MSNDTVWSEHFEEDLLRGENYEYIVLHNLQKIFPSAFKVKGSFKEYDIFVPEKEFGIEVKYDHKSNETGNILIELEFPIGKPSGLNTTKAKYWIITDGKDYVRNTPKNIKNFVKENNVQARLITGQGDTESKLVWLLPKEEFFESCENLNFQEIISPKV